ncbi:MAG: DUF4335 domain-containing protein [Jaaginema sp. PMC 1079.18]|nr:DUF4335 domain-containing protein [Jaaginema sp. PMC 1080.18]MEC4852109.1 DUF4335 domain-containing protein [Jaaginema sp. PMC 1079.18]MEC4868746.1 DUF4335 domain-containing protein [Jaaginema sp. PMC 1078.18]
MFSQSANRRYTPPTCTLQVSAKKSPLQAWTSHPLFAKASFELRFDDPRQLENRQVIVTGDGDQLEKLYEVVSDYVQDFLNHSTPARLQAYIPNPANDPVFPLAVAESLAVPGLLPPESKFVTATPTLQPRGLLCHTLYLGNLATETSGESIQLSATQLFDLANALESYHTEMMLLPQLPAARPAFPVKTWGSAVAGVVLAVGLTTAVFLIMQESPDTTETVLEPLPESEERISDLPTLPNPPVEPIPSPTVPGSISQGSQLPPPGAVNRSPAAANPPGTVETVPPNQRGSSTTTELPTAPPVTVQPRPSASPPGAIAPGNDPAANIPSLADSVPQQPVPQVEARRPNAPESIAEALGRNRQESNEDFAASGNSPQKDQIQSYFSQNWQPPENLEEELRYRLIVNTDGTLKRIIPLNNAAGIFIDRTPMPLLGKDFGLTPPQNNATPQIRLVLRPDGGVETYLENTGE